MISSNGARARQVGSVLFALSLAQGSCLAHSTPVASKTPIQVLKESMTRYETFATFQADCDWNVRYDSQPGVQETKRTLWYAKPNRFKVVSSHSAGGMVQTSVSDGINLLEFTTGVSLPSQRYDAPASIADAHSMQMGHPMFCGSLLYTFFGGPEKYGALVDEAKMPVHFGEAVTLEGQECTTVDFWAQGPIYGKTEIAIGKMDGLIHRIRYGSEPLMQSLQSKEMQAQIKEAMQSPEVKRQMEKAGKSGDPKFPKSVTDALQHPPTSSLTTETYTHMRIGEPIAPEVFTAKAP